MAGLMNSPEFMQGMAEMMSRPEIVEQVRSASRAKRIYADVVQMVAANPQLAGMAPQIRQMMQNPMVRQMLSNPESLRMVGIRQSACVGSADIRR